MRKSRQIWFAIKQSMFASLSMISFAIDEIRYWWNPSILTKHFKPPWTEVKSRCISIVHKISQEFSVVSDSLGLLVSGLSESVFSGSLGFWLSGLEIRSLGEADACIGLLGRLAAAEAASQRQNPFPISNSAAQILEIINLQLCCPILGNPKSPTLLPNFRKS